MESKGLRRCLRYNKQDTFGWKEYIWTGQPLGIYSGGCYFVLLRNALRNAFTFREEFAMLAIEREYQYNKNVERGDPV